MFHWDGNRELDRVDETKWGVVPRHDPPFRFPAGLTALLPLSRPSAPVVRLAIARCAYLGEPDRTLACDGVVVNLLYSLNRTAPYQREL